MKKRFWKRVLGVTLAGSMLMTAQTAYALEHTTDKAEKMPDYILVDDTVTDDSQKNYFTYQGGMDTDKQPTGETGWVADTKEGKWSSDAVATQHWVWNKTPDAASKQTYSFTFEGTGVELVGIKSDAYMNFKLDGKTEEKEIKGNNKEEVVLYAVQGLENKSHTVEVSMAQGKQGHGLQVSCARVYGAAVERLEQTEIPYTQQEGEVNRFQFSEKGWSEVGDEQHCWSDDATKFPKGSIWYQVDFVGSRIDIWAGKNKPHGDVSYTIFEKGSDKPVKEPVIVSHHADKNIEPAMVHSFDGLDEGKTYTMKAVALGTGEGKIMDCGKVVVHHKPYEATDFKLKTESYTLGEGQKQAVEYTVTPSYAAIEDLEFASADEKIVSVDAKTGRMMANQAGKTEITVKSKTYPKLVDRKIPVEVKVNVPNLDGSIVDIDTQYTEDRYSEVAGMKKVKESKLSAWKNDKAVSALALISKDSMLKNVTIKTQDLVSGEHKIPADNVTATFVKSTLAYTGPFLGYGSDRPNAPVPEVTEKNRAESSDILYQTTPMDIGWNEVQPVWVEFNIPTDAKAGVYTTALQVTADGIKEPMTFTYAIEVQDAVLPDATSFKDRFSIEFWHHPYASAEYYGVEPFSPEHLKVLESSQQIYKEIGGNTIYSTIVEESWKGQTWSSHNTEESPIYPSMVRWTKNSKGEFSFDYTHFDTWVQFNLDQGLGDKIVMFSIAPWHNSFKYYDEAGKLQTQSFESIGGVGSAEYNRIWTIFLQDLVAHLDQKGWFDRAYIGIDERGFAPGAFDVVESVKNAQGKHLKIMGYMDNVGDKNKYALALRCTDYSIGDNAAQTGHPQEFKKLLAERDAKGLKTTFYSCTEHRPGNFSLSQPVESYYSVVNTQKEGATGFARWAYDAWVEDPLEDATHHSFEPGDCFVIYPDLKSNKDHAQAKYSVRLARMAEGVRDNNKIMLMVEQYPQLQAKVDALYQTIQTKAYTANDRYLTDKEIDALRTEMQAFKEGLNALTKEYIALGGKGIAETKQPEAA